MSGPYDNIINLPHPTSKRHPRMSLHDRAAQFSPFAALSGHAAALAETTRLTDRKIELDEDTRAELDRRQAVLLEQISEQPEITVTWFQPDGKRRHRHWSSRMGRASPWRMCWNFRAPASATFFQMDRTSQCGQVEITPL